MENSNFLTNLIVIIVVLHFVVGFAYLMYKLSPRKEDERESSDQ